jgi:anti-sigma factor RsiW
MRCPIETGEIAEFLLGYCARKLDAGSTAVVEEHMRTCSACRELVGRQQAVWQALDSWEAAPIAVADFDRRLYRRIEAEVSWWDRLMRPFRSLLFGKGLPLVAAAGLVIFAGVLLERPVMVPGSVVPVSAQRDVVPPEQADDALQEMEMMRELDSLVHPAAADSKM